MGKSDQDGTTRSQGVPALDRWWIQIDGASFCGPWEASEDEERSAVGAWPGERRGPYASWNEAMDAGLDAIDHHAGQHKAPLEGCPICMSELREDWPPPEPIYGPSLARPAR